MKKTKAAFRALREECGLTQADIAVEADVRLLTVKKWESLSSDIKEPPDDVWTFLIETREALESEAQRSFRRIKEMSRGDDVPFLVYYKTQEELDERQLPELGRPYGYVNAVTRRVMQLMREAHMPFDVLYPSQVDFVYADEV